VTAQRHDGSNTPHPNRRRTLQALHGIRSKWTDTANPPHPYPTGTRGIPQSRPPAHHAYIRGNVTTTLAYWAQALHAHDHTLADSSHPVALHNPRETAAYLIDHIDRLLDWDGGAYTHEFTRDIIDADLSLTRLLDPHPKQRLGPCHLARDGTHINDNAHTARDRQRDVNILTPPCSGVVYADELDPVPGDLERGSRYLYATCDKCRTEALITWWQEQWRVIPRLVTTDKLVAALRAQGITTTAATIRWQLHKGRIYRSGTNGAGRSLWDVGAVVAALTLGATVGGSGTPMPNRVASGGDRS